MSTSRDHRRIVGANHDTTRCKVCGLVLRVWDDQPGDYAKPHAAYFGGADVPDDALLDEVPRPDALDADDAVAWRFDQVRTTRTIWALCETCFLTYRTG